MRVRLWSLLIGAALVLVCLVVVSATREREEKRRRAEIHMLKTIQGGIRSHLDAGGQLPTNLVALSNSVNWQLVVDISKHNKLPPPTECYTVLQEPIFYSDYQRTGFIFLVRSKPRKWVRNELGRWALVKGQASVNDLGPAGSSNRVFRVWLYESNLSPKIRLQTGNRNPN